MKVESMDASISQVQKVRETTANNAVKPATEKVKSFDRNISHMTEFERRELPISEKVVIDAIEKANKAISGATTRFEFSIHEETKEIMVKVLDSETNEVIREIPPEKILDLVAKMWEMAGLIVDERR